MLHDATIFLIIFCVGLIGILCCCATLRIIYKSAVLHNAFGNICAFHSICEAIILACFTFWGAPDILFKSWIEDNSLGATIGIICSFAYYNALYLHFLKSLNRFCAIIFPFHYRIIFSSRNVVIIFIFVLFISLITTSPYFIHSCNFYFSRDYFTWVVRDPECYSNYIIYIDMGWGCVVTGISVTSDAITFCYFSLLSKKMNKHNPATFPREIRFFFQACMTSFLYTVMLVSFHIISRLVTNEWAVFISTTMAWQLCHAFNELFFIIFNSKSNKTTNIQITGKSTTVEQHRTRSNTMIARAPGSQLFVNL